MTGTIYPESIVNFYQIEYFSSKKYFFLLELNAFLADRMLSQIEYSKDTVKIIQKLAFYQVNITKSHQKKKLEK